VSQKPNILIDARLYGPKHTGIGRYTKNLLLALTKQKNFSKYNFSVLLTELHPELKNYKQIITKIPHYSWQEQIFLPSTIQNLRPNLVHFTHFNKPIFYKGKSVITIHDLIKHFFRGKETTTKNPITYWPKYWLYLILTKINIQNNYLITPSNYWRDLIIKKFNVNPNKIITTHEAADPTFTNLKLQSSSKIPKNYIIYTGNLYPHKNIEVIIKALKYLPNIKLKIIGARDYFLSKYKEEYKNNHQIEFLGYIPDKKFKELYSKALCLVHPSLMEGFSLTGLEAMALNCPVISSNYSCLPEIYGDSVLYFDPHNPQDLAQKIKTLTPQKRQDLISKGKQQVKKYSWKETARQTLQFYESLLT
jgi:glycosyltransferase involved in cell wall biosynthesis